MDLHRLAETLILTAATLENKSRFLAVVRPNATPSKKNNYCSSSISLFLFLENIFGDLIVVRLTRTHLIFVLDYVFERERCLLSTDFFFKWPQ